MSFLRICKIVIFTVRPYCFVNVKENRPEVEDLPCEEMINQDNLAKQPLSVFLAAKVNKKSGGTPPSVETPPTRLQLLSQMSFFKIKKKKNYFSPGYIPNCLRIIVTLAILILYRIFNWALPNSTKKTQHLRGEPMHLFELFVPMGEGLLL